MLSDSPAHHNSAHHRWHIMVAATDGGGIGKDGQLPWTLARDLKYFSMVTSSVDHERFAASDERRNAVLMGRKTWESLPPGCRPLKNRINVIVSTKMSTGNDFSSDNDVYAVRSIQSAKDLLFGEFTDEVADIFVIGGSALFAEMICTYTDLISRAYITRVGVNVDCDVYMAPLPTDVFHPISISPTMSEAEINYDFVVYENMRHHSDEIQIAVSSNMCIDLWRSDKRPAGFYPYAELMNREKIDKAKRTADGSESSLKTHCCPAVRFRGHGEFGYLDLVADILNEGVKTSDRTGVGVLSTFGKTVRYDLRDSFPLLTTKRVAWKSVVEELLWFIKGDTNANHLTDKGVKIWEANGSRNFLDNLGLTHREVGDLGPIYGFQWRHFGAEYKDMHADYTGQGVDQLQRCIDLIKDNPDDRRIIMSAWNPAAQPLMALPPCHMFCQFYVANGELSCCMYQRSADIGLGVPFNIASYALLTVMIAHVCGMKTGEFIHVTGNTHAYLNHIGPLREQLSRMPKPFPILKVNTNAKTIEDFKFEDFELVGYHPHPRIPMDMAV